MMKPFLTLALIIGIAIVGQQTETAVFDSGPVVLAQGSRWYGPWVITKDSRITVIVSRADWSGSDVDQSIAVDLEVSLDGGNRWQPYAGVGTIDAVVLDRKTGQPSTATTLTVAVPASQIRISVGTFKTVTTSISVKVL